MAHPESSHVTSVFDVKSEGGYWGTFCQTIRKIVNPESVSIASKIKSKCSNWRALRQTVRQIVFPAFTNVTRITDAKRQCS